MIPRPSSSSERGRTDAIFQFESSGMKEICRKLGPDGIDDLAALNALYRPGPIDSGMVDDFIDRRHGRKKVVFDFPVLKDILGPTLGIVVFQEQVMAIFQCLAGYSLGEADIVRRIMGKKKRDELDKHKARFIDEGASRGYNRTKLEKLWQMLEGFADYAFNKSHSVAYALLAYQTAYLKAHYPTHFWSAVLSNELDNSDKVSRYIAELRTGGIEVLPPDINISTFLFTPAGGQIRFGLTAIKGLGQSAVSAIVEARDRGGPFRSMHDVCERVDSKALNKRVAECLIKSGAFDAFGKKRRQLFLAIDSAVESGARAQRDRATGQVGLFAMADLEAASPDPVLPDVDEWNQLDLLTHEKETLGFYITGHPLARYRVALEEFATSDVGGLSDVAAGETVKLGGLVNDLAVRNTKKGDRFALFQLQDGSGSVKVVAWPETFKNSSRCIVAEAAVLVTGRLERTDDGASTVIAEEIRALDDLREREARAIAVHAPAASMTAERIEQLHALLDRHRGECDVEFVLGLADGSRARIQPNRFVRVHLTPELRSEIRKICPESDVQIHVRRPGMPQAAGAGR
ncbi:MAG: DNA polymerase III subunit alpha [Blastocatellia bacterium]|nr:DNA polymerase III subunit alpha [Blastocatellia bacterium]